MNYFSDSLAYAIPRVDVYSKLAEISDEFDFSEYPQGHALRSTVNRKVLGKFKDELNGRIMEKFVGLRPKVLFTFISCIFITVRYFEIMQRNSLVVLFTLILSVHTCRYY